MDKGIVLYSGEKPIEARKRLLEEGKLDNMLSPIDHKIFIASTRKQISELSDSELVGYLSKLFRYVVEDIGYTIHSAEDWQRTCTRLMKFIRDYYGNITLSDIKLSFELLVLGELDDYLPRNKYGEADRKHYNQFNVDYLSRIINAYLKRQNVVFDIAYKKIPVKDNNITEKTKAYFLSSKVKRCAICFLRYKYTGRFQFALSEEMFVYNWLYSVGLADYIEETEEDRKEALSRYLGRASKRHINEYTVFNVRREGLRSKEIDYTAYEVARKKEIKKAFDRMVEDELYINHYLRVKL